MRHPMRRVAAMGINNRQRRAAKARQRARKHERRRTEPDSPPTDHGPSAALGRRHRAWHGGRTSSPSTTLAPADAALVTREAESLLAAGGREVVGQRLAAGRSDPARSPCRWSCRTADGRRRRRRSRPPGSRRHCTRAGPPSWSRSIFPTPERRPAGSLSSPESSCSTRSPSSRPSSPRSAAAYGAGRLHTIIPPPGTPKARSMVDHDPAIDDPVLLKVRALLAQAESTTFEAEAEAFTAKAQELMARHAIDAAVLWSTTERSERPITIRIPIDDPYVDIKSLLLQCVARRSRCRAVWDDRHALATVVGFASDVAGTEMLFTSLLVQAQAALQAEGAKAGPGGRSRSRSFRSAFLMAFTQRIDQRLAEINRAVEQYGRCRSWWVVAARSRLTRQRRRGRGCLAVRQPRDDARPGRRRCCRMGTWHAGSRPRRAQHRRGDWPSRLTSGRHHRPPPTTRPTPVPASGPPAGGRIVGIHEQDEHRRRVAPRPPVPSHPSAAGRSP